MNAVHRFLAHVYSAYLEKRGTGEGASETEAVA